jgi:hypothetical protein
VYDLEVKTPGLPIELKQVATAERVRAVIEHALAGWGIPIPVIAQPAHRDEFAALLAETGEYHHADDRARVTVKRSA